MGTTKVLTAPPSPSQNPSAERLMGSIRRECLDQVIALGEKDLRRILRNCFDYYLASKTHLSLDRDAPTTRVGQGPEAGQIVEIPQVGGGALRNRVQVEACRSLTSRTATWLAPRRTLVGAKARPAR